MGSNCSLPKPKRKVVKKMEPGSSQERIAGARGTTGISGNGKFRLDWRNFSVMRTVKQWKNLISRAVQSLSSEVYKTRLEKALGNVVWPPNWPWFWARGWTTELPRSLNDFVIFKNKPFALSALALFIKLLRSQYNGSSYLFAMSVICHLQTFYYNLVCF